MRPLKTNHCYIVWNEQLHVNAHKTENISTLNGSFLKLVDKFTYLGSSVSSTETDINTLLVKAWSAINRLSVIWKSDLTDKMKQFFPSSGCVHTAVWMHNIDANKMYGEKVDSNYTRMLRAILNKSWRQHPTKHQLYRSSWPQGKTEGKRKES